MEREEQEAINTLKRTIKNSNYCDSIGIGQIEIVLNYIDKLQKENEDMREELQMYVDTDVMILQKELKDSINARFELQRRIDKTQKENAELKEEIKDLIEENHKHIDYIANMKKKHEDKIRTKIKELENKKEQYSEQPLIYHILKSQLEELLGDE